MFVYYFRRLALMVSSHLAAIIEPKKIAIVTSAQSGKLSITIPGICAPTRPFSSPSGLSPITPERQKPHRHRWFLQAPVAPRRRFSLYGGRQLPIVYAETWERSKICEIWRRFF